MKSKLEYALKLASKGYKVFPLHENSKVPVITDFKNKATTDAAAIEKWWKGKNYNIGISTNELLVVDVDVKNPKKNGLKTIEELNKQGLRFPPTAQQVTTTEGLHLIYRAPYPLKNSVGGLGDGLDVRAYGGYIVGAGSTIDGKPYRLLAGEIADPEEWLVKKCAQANTKESAAKVPAIPVDEKRATARALKYLSELPEVEEGTRNAAAFKTAAKLKDFGLSKEHTLLLMLDEWKCEPMIEQEELAVVVKSAYKYGTEVQGSDSPEATFGADGKKETDKGTHPFDELNKSYAFVMIGEGHRILRESTKKDGSFHLDFYREESWHRKLANRMHYTSDGVGKPLSRCWMSYERRRSYDGLVFAPEKPFDPAFYNMWRGFSTKEVAESEEVTEDMKKAVTMFEEHILENIVSGNKDHFNYVMAWFAHILQKPYEKPEVALVLRGEKGVGKNIVLETIGAMIKENFLVAAHPRYMLDKFNSHMEKLLLFTLDEAFWSGSKEADSILKDMITGKTIKIERKGVDPFVLDSYLRVAILGNDNWVVPASNDERRFAVFDVGSGRKQDRAFFGEMRRCLDAGGDRLLYTKLKNMDISKIDVATAPMTKGLERQKISSLSILQQWWKESIDQGYMEGIDNFDDAKWPEEINKSLVYSAISDYFRNRHVKSWMPSITTVLEELKTLSPGIEAKKFSGGRDSILFPELEACRRNFRQFLSGKQGGEG